MGSRLKFVCLLKDLLLKILIFIFSKIVIFDVLLQSASVFLKNFLLSPRFYQMNDNNSNILRGVKLYCVVSRRVESRNLLFLISYF